GCTRSRPTCRRSSVVSASRSSRPRRACSPTGTHIDRAWAEKSSPTSGETRQTTRRTDMSRIGKLPITIPSGVDVTLDGQQVSVKGPKGQLAHTVAEPITVAKTEDGTIEVSRPNDERRSRALHGLTRTLVSNMVIGVTEGYEKDLEIVGVGYRVLSKGPSALEFNLGYSHSIPVTAPEGITFTVESPTKLKISGI